MNHWRRYVIGTGGAATMALVLSAASPRPAFAQLNQPTHQAILDAITTSGSALLAALGAIQNSVNALTSPTQSNFRATPPLAFVTVTDQCSVVNVSSAVRKVRVVARDVNGLGGSTTLTLQPGESRTFTHDFPGFVFFSYCTFEVFDAAGTAASRTDIRAALSAERFSGEFVMVPAE